MSRRAKAEGPEQRVAEVARIFNFKVPPVVGRPPRVPHKEEALSFPDWCASPEYRLWWKRLSEHTARNAHRHALVSILDAAQCYRRGLKGVQSIEIVRALAKVLFVGHILKPRRQRKPVRAAAKVVRRRKAGAR